MNITHNHTHKRTHLQVTPTDLPTDVCGRNGYVRLADIEMYSLRDIPTGDSALLPAVRLEAYSKRRGGRPTMAMVFFDAETLRTLGATLIDMADQLAEQNA